MKTNKVYQQMLVLGLLLFAWVALPVSATSTVVFTDNFSGTTLDTANWIFTGCLNPDNGEVSQDNGLYFPPDQYAPDNYGEANLVWGRVTAVSKQSWPRSQSLQITVSYTLSASAGGSGLIQVIPAGENYNIQSDAGYAQPGYSAMVTADNGAVVWAENNTAMPNYTSDSTPGASAIVRFTLDPVQGCLWQFSTNGGSSYSTALDTRGGAELCDPTQESWQIGFQYWNATAATDMIINWVQVEYLSPTTPTATPTPPPSGGIVLQDNFSGTTLNTANWAVTGAAPTVDNIVAIPAAGFNTNYLTSKTSWPAYNNGQVLQVTVNYYVMSGCLLFAQLVPVGKLEPSGSSYAYDCTSYGAELGDGSIGVYADEGDVWPTGGPPGYVGIGSEAWPEPNIIRMTMDPVQGVLWEQNTWNGSTWTGYVTVKDTRGATESQDPMTTGTNWNLVLASYGGSGSYVYANSVEVQYITPPAQPTPPPSGIVLQDEFSGTALNAANWAVTGTAPTEDAALYLSNGLYNSDFVASVGSWPASWNSKVLQVTIVYNLEDAGTVFFPELIPEGVSSDYYNYTDPGYGAEIDYYAVNGGSLCYADADFNWLPGGPPGSASFSSPECGQIRITLDSEQGALWEVQNSLYGSGFIPIKDTRYADGSGDSIYTYEAQDPMTNATNWRLIMQGPTNNVDGGDPSPVVVGEVLVEYVTPPTN